MQQQAAPQVAALPEDSGVAALAAPNMESMDGYAGGGIVAFDEGGSVNYDEGGAMRFNAAGQVSVPSVLGAFGGPAQRTATVPMSFVNGIPVTTEFGTPLDRKRLEEIIRARNPNITAGELQTAVANAMNQARAQIAPTPAAAINQVAAAPQGVAQVAPAPTAAAGKPTVRRIDGGAQDSGIPNYGAPRNVDPMAFAERFAPLPTGLMPTQTPIEAARAERAMYEELGIDLDPYKKRRESLESEAANSKADRERLGYEALLEFGGRLGTTPGSLLRAATVAGSETAPSIISGLREVKKLDRERNKELADLNAIRAKMDKDLTDAGIARLQRQKDKAEERLFNIQDRRAQIASGIASQQMQGQYGLASASLSARATIAKLEEQLGETQTKNIVDAASKLLAGNMSYISADPATQDTMLQQAIQQVMRARALATAPTVTKQ
jgi:type II secretory pathway component PulJ